MAKHTVLHVSRYNFVDKDTGRQVQGTKVTFIDREAEVNVDARGLKPMFVTCPHYFFDKFPEVPGSYELETGLKADKSGKPTIVIHDAKFVGKNSDNQAA